VPLYDSLGENAVEYIVNHAGVELVFIDVAKLHEFVKVSTACACAGSCHVMPTCQTQVPALMSRATC
jgi:long-subunit acyl-CoA synthetase (AMP-forming)